MPIVNLQRQFRELGRIRLGEKGPKGQPKRLSTWRLTSPDRSLLEAAAAEYQGEVVAWPDAPDGDEWQLITLTDSLDIIIPPGQPLTQWNELWSGAGCQRRCDGQREWLNDTPCVCPADPAERNELASKGGACKPTSRLQVILPKLPDLGTFLYVSHGYYAAVELAGTADLLAAAAAQGGRMIRASLWIDQRTVKRPGQPTKHFPVPAIRIHETMIALLAGGGAGPALIGSGERIPAQLTTTATLPDSTAFASTVTDGCAHPPDQYDVDDEGIHCGVCHALVAARSQPEPVAARGAAPDTAPAAVSLPPGGGSPATLAEATTRVGKLAVAHRLVSHIETDDDWSRFDDVMRMHGVDRLALDETPAAVASWNALGDRIEAGEFDRVAQDAGRCAVHGEPWKWIPAGTNRAGKDYNAFFACPARDCKERPSDAWRRAHKPAAEAVA